MGSCCGPGPALTADQQDPAPGVELPGATILTANRATARSTEACTAPVIALAETKPIPPATKWAHIEGGDVTIGSTDPEGFASDGEGPARTVRLSPYRIATTTVTNAEFAEFIAATGYRTEAERTGRSFVFYLQLTEAARAAVRQVVADLPWWLIVPGACWREPHGAGSSWVALADHPVVHVSWHDAMAFCAWREVALPTEAQWEHAARGGQSNQRYPWGDALEPQGERQCNIWQGRFPNAPVDGWQPGTVAASSFTANGFGLHNTSGNVWEWCADWFNADYHRHTELTDPVDCRPSGRRSQRGGSFLCHASYCNRYRNAARGANSPSSSTSHTGFRIVTRAQ
jgi:formylglycine-generating enzyme required for sulfatase activity